MRMMVMVNYIRMTENVVGRFEGLKSLGLLGALWLGVNGNCRAQVLAEGKQILYNQ